MDISNYIICYLIFTIVAIIIIWKNDVKCCEHRIKIYKDSRDFYIKLLKENHEFYSKLLESKDESYNNLNNRYRDSIFRR